MLAALLVAGLAARSGSPPHALKPPTDRVVLLAAGDAEYRALAIPRSYKSAPDAPMHLLVFQGGLCVKDIGLLTTQSSGSRSIEGRAFVEETGSIEGAHVAEDERSALLVRTRYVSRVEVTAGQSETANDTVTGGTTLTLIDPAHPDGTWQVTLEDGRWPKDAVVLTGGRGVAVTTFLPRNGPTDIRIFDAAGHETDRIPESAGRCLTITPSRDGGYVAAEIAFTGQTPQKERGVVVFDVVKKTNWTYGWDYGSDAEPISWTLEDRGVLAVRLARGTRRFSATGRPH